MLRKQSSEADPADWFYLAADRLKAADLIWKSEGLQAVFSALIPWPARQELSDVEFAVRRPAGWLAEGRNSHLTSSLSGLVRREALGLAYEPKIRWSSGRSPHSALFVIRAKIPPTG